MGSLSTGGRLAVSRAQVSSHTRTWVGVEQSVYDGMCGTAKQLIAQNFNLRVKEEVEVESELPAPLVEQPAIAPAIALATATAAPRAQARSACRSCCCANCRSETQALNR
mmetsp:Transcript_62542/g.123581  ORF Transcript_62542/g.123581 Transcript_62542/m.123581 type:complete len:110 (+) Transcript_62542:723-1052(+)